MTMKKIVLLASACTLAFLAGCTRENPTEGVKPEKGGITFMGSFDTDETKVYIGDYTDGAKNIPIYWENNDEIGIKFTFASKAAAKVSDNNTYYASTQEPSTTTAFHTDDWSKVSFEKAWNAESDPNPEDIVTFAAYYPYEFQFNNMDGTGPSPLKANQSYDVYTNKATDQMFMIAINEAGKLSEVEKESTVIDLKFTNAFALVNVGVKGTATIDKVTIKGATTPLSYEGATIDLFKAPASGTTATDFMSSGFLTPATEAGEEGGEGGNEPDPAAAGDPISGESVSLVLSYPMTLNSETAWLPIMVPPFSFDTATGLTIEIEGTDKTGAKQTITRTLGVGAEKSDITTNSILYIELKDITATELGQDEPKTTWQPGDEIFTDNFHWITELTEWTDGQHNTNGWVNSYDANVGYRQYNYLDANKLSLLSHGYVYAATNVPNNLGLYSYDGMIQIGDSKDGELVIPMTKLASSDPVNIIVNFKAARYAYRYGNYSEYAGGTELSNEVPVIVTGNGTIKGTEETKYIATPEDPFTWYEYSVVIEGVTSTSKIVFGEGSSDPNAWSATRKFFLDDIEIKIASDSDVSSDAAGTKIEPSVSSLIYSTVNDDADNKTITINSVKDIQSDNSREKAGTKWEFVVDGTWKLDVTDKPAWVDISSVSWSNNSDPLKKEDPNARRYFDDKGNQMTNIFWISAAEDNDDQTERSWDLKLLNSEGTTIETLTIEQPVAPTQETIYSMSFGEQTEATVAINAENAQDATVWGIEIGDATWLTIPLYQAPAEGEPSLEVGSNPYLALSNEYPQNEENGTYDGATPNGNLKLINKFNANNDRKIAQFHVTIPSDQLTGKSYIYLDFGLWANPAEKDTGNYADIYAQPTFGELPSYISSNIRSYESIVPGWQHYSIRANVTEGQDCNIFILVDQSWNNDWKSGSDVYRIDDVKILVR